MLNFMCENDPALLQTIKTMEMVLKVLLPFIFCTFALDCMLLFRKDKK